VFKTLEKNMQKKIISNSTAEVAEIVLRNARALVPVDTGNLKDKLKISAFKSKRGIGHQVKTPTRKQLGVDTNPKKGYYPAHIEFGFLNARTGKHVPPNPFLRPAIKNHEDSLRTRLILKIKRRLLNAARAAERKR